MAPLTRRSVTTGLVVAVTAIPAVGLTSGAKAAIAEPELLARVRAFARQLTAEPQNEPKLGWGVWLERERIGRELQRIVGEEKARR